MTSQIPQSAPPVDFPIVGYFDRQRFLQFNPSDTANWYLVDNPLGKKKIAMYPAMGRRHIFAYGLNRLIFSHEARGLFDSINYSYAVIENSIYRIDRIWGTTQIDGGKVTTFSTDIFFSYVVTPSETYAVFVDGQHVYIYNENTGSFDVVTGIGTPVNPTYVVAFGNRIVVSNGNSSQFNLSNINLRGGAGGSFDANKVFEVNGSALFAQEAGIIRQMCVLHNTLYIFTDFTTGIWSNTPSVVVSTVTTTTFPWKKNTSYDWDFGILNPNSLSVGFGRITWIAQNDNGLIQVMSSTGSAPKRISTRAVDILFQRGMRQGVIGSLSAFVGGKAEGFMYEWENTIFYRVSAGEYTNNGILDIQDNANSIEFNFENESWNRVIEKNGERNRIKKHVYFNFTHLVTVQNDTTIYEMSGQFYDNEITNPLREDPQSDDAYLREPFRYERSTPLIFEDDYSEFIDDWVQIDFVWGENFNISSESPFENAEFLIDEDAGTDGSPQYLIDDQLVNGNPVYLISEEGNTPSPTEIIYNQTFRPHIELYFSDDGGVSFFPADVREFSQLGFYSWRMRWYQLGASRNRVYKLVCVSNSPIVVLGGLRLTRRVGDGSY